MMRKFWLTASFLLCLSCLPGKAQIAHFTLDHLEQMKKAENDTLYIVNFWATWCKPCVAELPYFEQADSAYKNHKVKVVLVSLDFPNMIPEKVLEFAARKGLKSTIMWMAETDENKWINAISPEWSGAIPATLFVRGHKQAYKLQPAGYASFADLKADIDALNPE